MPQMSPMYWLLMLYFFIIFYLLILMFFYYVWFEFPINFYEKGKSKVNSFMLKW